MNKLLRKLKIDLYTCSVKIVITDTGSAYVHSLFKKNNMMDRWELEGPKDNNFSGFAIDVDLENYYIIFNTLYPIDHGTINHEIWHLVNYMFDMRNIVENRDHEAGAWLAGHLAQEIYNTLEKNNIKIK